jgi:hypothetical protein
VLLPKLLYFVVQTVLHLNILSLNIASAQHIETPILIPLPSWTDAGDVLQYCTFSHGTLV